MNALAVLPAAPDNWPLTMSKMGSNLPSHESSRPLSPSMIDDSELQHAERDSLTWAASLEAFAAQQAAALLPGESDADCVGETAHETADSLEHALRGFQLTSARAAVGSPALDSAPDSGNAIAR